MSDVMDSCTSRASFDDYVSCLKVNYERRPNHRVIKSFYAQLDAIAEDVRLGNITETRARAQAYQVYDSTVGAANERRRDRIRENRRNASKPTTCYKAGTQIYCY